MSGNTTDQQSAEPQSTELLKLVAYNTSFANDAHYSQLHNFLSESAAIVAKAIKIYKSDPANTNDPENFDSLVNYFKTLDIKKPEEPNDADMSEQLGYVRMQLADSATKFISQRITVDNVSFVALIEQMIHVPSGNAAYYDNGVGRKSDLTNPESKTKTTLNENYGILRRITKLGVDDIDNVSTGDESKTHAILYDNVVNIDNNTAEGIAIIVDKTKYLSDKFTPLKWKRSRFNVRQKLVEVGKLTSNADKDIRFISDDLGLLIQPYDISNPKNVKFLKMNGTFDYGRPIILTASFSSDTLNIFVALHNPNILNLVYCENKLMELVEVNNIEILREILKNKSADKSKDNKDSIDELLKLISQTNNLIGNTREHSVFNSDLLKILLQKYRGELFSTQKVKEFCKTYKISEIKDEQLLKDIYTKLNSGIVEFIKSSIEKATNSKEIPPNCKCNVFLGGDFNDPRGLALRDIIMNGFTLSIEGLSLTNGGKIQFRINGLSPEDAKDNSKFDNFRQTLFSCCANRDSQKAPQPAVDTLGSLEDAFYRVLGREQPIKDKKPKQNLKYQDNFDVSENFGYNGDYALFGTNYLSDETKFNISLQESSYEHGTDETPQKVMASDHMPVYAEISIPVSTVTIAAAPPQQGGRRRRYSIRALKRHTKKGLPKKLRASRRKRRARTYRKH